MDIPLAWKRAKLDRPDRVFFTHPQAIAWIETDPENWCASINKDLGSGYSPKSSYTCYVPKPGWLVRPGAVLDLRDEVVFNALLGTLHERIYTQIGSFQGDPDIAYQLQRQANLPEWIRTGYKVWKEWREKSLAKLNQGSQFVVLADIAGFYENIDLSRLSTDLKPLASDSSIADLLMNCLNRWAHPRGKGIPQGYSGSDILAKLYVHPIDQGLRNEGISHLRYVDDIRIFCKTNLEAKRSMLLLNELVRRRGLNLQTAKTKILRADEAKQEIDGVSPLIQNIQTDMLTELKELFSGVGAYVTIDEIERRFNERPEGPAPEVLEQAFHDHFANAGNFNKTLLHFLFTRLGKAKSKIAVPYAVGLLEQRPEETGAALRYLRDAGVDNADEQNIVKYMSSADAIYDYQLYEITTWFFHRHSYPEPLVQLCRKWAFDHNRAHWLRAIAISLLGEAGDQSDLEAIEGSYERAANEEERAGIVAALARMETGRRNSFYGRVQADGDLVGRAVRLVKSSPSR